jgi:outer membrane protein
MKKIVVILSCMILTSSGIDAQTAPKIGWIESAELLQSMPEKARADSDIAKYQKDFQGQIEKMMKDYEVKVKQYQDGEKTMSQVMKDIKGKEIQDLQSRIEAIQQSAQEKIQARKNEVYAPILNKADKAIQAVAKENNYDYIFDKSGGSLLFGKDGNSIMPLVKAKLGIQ